MLENLNNEQKLAVDLHNALNNDSEDAIKLLEDFRKKHFNNKPKELDLDDVRKEIKEAEDYFNSL